MTEETERTDDAAFTDEAASELGAATIEETARLADEEDGSSPEEPQPETYPDPDTEEPGTEPVTIEDVDDGSEG